MSFLTNKQRRQLELCGIEPEKRQLPPPMWMQVASAGVFKALAVLVMVIVGINVAHWTVDREGELQRQQKTMLRSVK